MPFLRSVRVNLHALGLTLHDIAFDLVQAFFVPGAQRQVNSWVAPGRLQPRWRTAEAPVFKSLDGATLGGPMAPVAGAKYVLKKGLPLDPEQRALAIENDPHTLVGFSGVIPEGYGKGTKTLLYRDTVIVKAGGKVFESLLEYHFHQADKAGAHFDLAIGALPPNTPDWEINIPRGPYKGRFAFKTTAQGLLVIPMKDQGVQVAKPDYMLKPVEYLRTVSPETHSIEHKIDGSLANAYVGKHYRVTFRSHRDTGETYYDRLPAVEFIQNRSCWLLCRKFFPGPDLERTLFRVELYHPEGAARVGGILNSMPDKARVIQLAKGPVEAYAWDLVKYRGRDVSHLPYEQRRELYLGAVQQIRLFNQRWHAVAACAPNQDPTEFYNWIISHPLPWGEGVVIKPRNAGVGITWPKVKDTDLVDVQLVEVLEGNGKYAGSAGKMIVRNPANGAIGKLGSLAVTDEYRQWIWNHRSQLNGAYVKARVQQVTSRGAPRAGVFVQFHEGKGPTEAGLIMYAESLAGGDPSLAQEILYKLKSAAGWRRRT